MPLEKQTASVNLTGSLDTKTEAFTVEANGVLISENTDYEFPNKLIKQKGVEDFSKVVQITNPLISSTRTEVAFSANLDQYLLAKTNDNLAIIPKSGRPNFIKYDRADDKFKLQKYPYFQMNNTTALTLEKTYVEDISFQDTTFPKVWQYDFYVSAYKDIQLYAVSDEQILTITVIANGTVKKLQVPHVVPPTQIKCAILDGPNIPMEDVVFVVFGTFFVANTITYYSFKIDMAFSTLVVPSIPNGVYPLDLAIQQFDVTVEANRIYLTYWASSGGGQFVTAVLEKSAFTLPTYIGSYPNGLAPLSINAFYPMIQSCTVGDNIFVFYISSTRRVACTVFNITGLGWVANKAGIPYNPIRIDAGYPVENEIINFGVGYLGGSQFILVITQIYQSNTYVDLNNGNDLHTRIYNFDFSNDNYNFVLQLPHVGSPTRVRVYQEADSTLSCYFGLSSGYYKYNDLDEVDLVMSMNFPDQNAYQNIFASPVARYNIYNGQGGISPGGAFFFYGSKGIENCRAFFLKDNDFYIGGRTTNLRDKNSLQRKCWNFSLNIFSRVGSIQSVKVDQYAIFSGAYPAIFDGNDYTKNNISMIPYIFDATESGGAGTLAIGTYLIKYYVEYLNANGAVELSPISNTFSVTTTLVNSGILIKHKVEPFKDPFVKRITYKFFITEPSGTAFYLTKATYSDYYTSGGYTILTDVVTGSELIYTSGDVLESQLLPPIDYFHVAKSRVFGINAQDRNEIYFSNKILRGEFPSFNGLLVLRQDSENSTRNNYFTAISSMDDKVVTFKRSNIFYFYGDGPNELGTGSPFTELFKISSDVGCSEPKSVVQTPLGIMFKSLKGYYLLSRDLTLIRIGEPVNAYQDLPCTMATLLEKKNEVRFLTQTITLCYNFEQNKWSVINYGGDDASLFDDQYYILDRTTPALFKLSETGFLDKNGDVMSMKIVTPWYKVSGIQDFGRFYHAYILGRFKSDHSLNVRVYYDYDDTNYSDFSINPLSTDKQYQYRVNIPKQKCESIKFEIWDLDQTGTGESMELIDMTFTIGQKKGTFKLADRRRY